MGCQRKPQTFALRRNSTRPPMVLPAVCLSGGNSTGPLSFSPSRTAGNFSTKKVEKKASLGGGCCQVPLEDHQALHEDPCVLLKQARRAKVLRENCDSLANKSLKKHGHILPTLPVLGVPQPAGPVRRRHWRSLRTILSSPRTILSSRGGNCQNHLSQGPTHPKPSLPSWPWSPVSLPWPDRDRKPLQHFLLFPAYKFCERKLAITRFQKKKNQESIKDHQEKPSRRLLYPSHQSKTPTLASEQRNAHPPPQPPRRLSPKWPDCRPVASGLESLWPPPGAKKGHHQHQPTAAPPETGEVKKQTSNSRSSSGRKYRKQSEASIRPRRGL